jgi:mono/diheme cytochrome c family protein
MSRTGRTGGWAALVAVFCLGFSSAAFYPGGAAGQLRDPPFGWDMWDPEWTQRDAWRPDRMDLGMRWRMTRHWTFMQDGVPAEYQDARGPMTPAPEAVDEGRALYMDSCARCHDPSGTGHGDAGLALMPSPALLAHMVRMPHAVDEYLLWAIAEGGEPFGTDMPAFKEELSRGQIWQIIAFMRAGFPEEPADDR